MGVAVEMWLVDTVILQSAPISTASQGDMELFIECVRQNGTFFDSIPVNALGHARFRQALTKLGLTKLIERPTRPDTVHATPTAGFLMLDELEAAQAALAGPAGEDEALDGILLAAEAAIEQNQSLVGIIL